MIPVKSYLQSVQGDCKTRYYNYNSNLYYILVFYLKIFQFVSLLSRVMNVYSFEGRA